MIKIDLHTHSFASPDGGISIFDYQQMLKNKKLDYIAVTDHDTISGALGIQKKLGPSIIIGQEITTMQGEIIGLFLTKRIKPGMSAVETVQAIKSQGGLVYIPHPFETVRKGITKDVLNGIADSVDIVEAFNGRAFFQNKGPEAATWAKLNNKVTSASSDAHGVKGLGTCFSEIKTDPTAQNLVEQLRTSHLKTKRPPFYSLLYPKLNRLRGKLKPN